MALIFDTSVLLATLDAKDPDHLACSEVFKGTTEERVVPLLVLPEMDYWCHKRLGSAAAVKFQAAVLTGAFRVEVPTDEDLNRALEVQKIYSDLEVGVVDASILALAERLSEQKLATLDHRHFGTMRPKHVGALELLPVT